MVYDRREVIRENDPKIMKDLRVKRQQETWNLYSKDANQGFCRAQWTE